MIGDGVETAICVLGAPRSGTSLTARTLNLCGLYLGESRDLLPPGPENHAGYWELRRAVKLNERILVAVGGSSVAAPALPLGWEAEAELEDLRSEARTLIAKIFAGRPAWGWKDPRNSFTLPFWRSLLTQPPRSVVCVRNPLDAAASGRRMAGTRHAMDERQAIDVWERYTASAVVNTSGHPRLFVSYEDYFADCRAVAVRLARFAGLRPPSQADNRALGTLVDRRLRHHSSSLDSALRSKTLPASARSLYRALQTPLRQAAVATGNRGAVAEKELDRLARHILDAEPEKLVGPPSLRNQSGAGRAVRPE